LLGAPLAWETSHRHIPVLLFVIVCSPRCWISLVLLRFCSQLSPSSFSALALAGLSSESIGHALTQSVRTINAGVKVLANRALSFPRLGGANKPFACPLMEECPIGATAGDPIHAQKRKWTDDLDALLLREIKLQKPHSKRYGDRGTAYEAIAASLNSCGRLPWKTDKSTCKGDLRISRMPKSSSASECKRYRCRRGVRRGGSSSR
jgi:hypothetical protein